MQISIQVPLSVPYTTDLVHCLGTLTYCSVAGTIFTAPPVISLVPRATFIPSFQTTIGLPCSCIPLASAINILQPYGVHLFYPCLQTIATRSAPLCSSTHSLTFYSISFLNRPLLLINMQTKIHLTQTFHHSHSLIPAVSPSVLETSLSSRKLASRSSTPATLTL